MLEDNISYPDEPQGSPKTVHSPPNKEKKIPSYFLASPDAASSGSTAKRTPADEASEEQADSLTAEKISPESTRVKPKKKEEKQSQESTRGATGQGRPAVESGKQHLEQDQGKAEVGTSRTARKRSKKKQDATSKQPEITKHFPVRRSSRRCKSVVEEERRKNMEEAILAGREEGVEVREVEGKGRGVFATRAFQREEFVCEYAGELIDIQTAQERETFYQGKAEFGCYMYYFNFNNKKYCVDATKETGRMGRLLNHSKCGNCATRLVSIRDRPHLILQTKRDIKAGEELLYDYGERNKEIIASHPWLET